MELKQNKYGIFVWYDRTCVCVYGGKFVKSNECYSSLHIDRLAKPSKMIRMKIYISDCSDDVDVRVGCGR